MLAGFMKRLQLFVEQYNEMIDKLNAELSAKRYSDYKPQQMSNGKR